MGSRMNHQPKRRDRGVDDAGDPPDDEHDRHAEILQVLQEANLPIRLNRNRGFLVTIDFSVRQQQLQCDADVLLASIASDRNLAAFSG